MSGSSVDKLLARLERGQHLPAIVLLGSDPYLKDLCRNKILDATVPESARDWAVSRISLRENSWTEALQRAETMPMLSPRQVIIVQEAECVERLGENSRDEILEELTKYFKSPAPFSLLLIEASSLDGRQRFTKFLQENTLVVELNIGPESAAALATQIARDLGGDIDREAAAMLADAVNGEPARIRVELQKLTTYAGGTRAVSAADVEALVVAAQKNTVWQMTDMLSTRKRSAALAFLDNLLREGEQPVAIVGALAWTYRKLIEARSLPAHTPGYQATRQLQMNSQAAEAAVRNAHRFSKTELLSGLIALAEADSKLKSANPDPRALMEFLICRLTSAA